jgi:hypothetical protein
MLGWAIMDPVTLPPSSLLLAYWMGGAFLMGSKRLSEYRDIVGAQGKELLAAYRRSFHTYTEESLLISSFLYALLSSFFIAVFLVKYRIEYILALPAFAVLFAVYLSLSLKRDSVAQRPEKLFREGVLMTTVGVTVALLIVLTFVPVPGLEQFSVDGSTDERPITFVGSDADELVVIDSFLPTQVDVDLGGGDDVLRAGSGPAPGSRIHGGPGRDLLAVSSEETDLEVDLKRSRLVVEAAAPHRVSVTDVEDADVAAPHVVLKGTPRSNTLRYLACQAVVKGREGVDTVVRSGYDPFFEITFDCRPSARIDGGPGNDRLSGTRGEDAILGNDGHDVLLGDRGDDKLFGGRGRDRAVGGEGRDRCDAEKKRGCER